MDFSFLQHKVDLKYIQQAIGGYFAVIMMEDGRIMYVNEDGKFLNLEINSEATAIMGYPIYGTVIIAKQN